MTIIHEASGARWAVRIEGSGHRSVWVFIVDGVSTIKPGVIGFYAGSLREAIDALNP